MAHGTTAKNCGSQKQDCTQFGGNQTGCCSLSIADNTLSLSVDPFMLDPVCATMATCKEAGYKAGADIKDNCKLNELNCMTFKQGGFLAQTMPCDCKYPISLIASYNDKDGKVTDGMYGSDDPVSTDAKTCSVLNFNPISQRPELVDQDCTSYEVCGPDCGCCAKSFSNPLGLMQQTFEGYDFMSAKDMSCVTTSDCYAMSKKIGTDVPGCTLNAPGCIKTYNKGDVVNGTNSCDCKYKFGVITTFTDAQGKQTVSGEVVPVAGGRLRRS
jgi:hypothetical protein